VGREKSNQGRIRKGASENERKGDQLRKNNNATAEAMENNGAEPRKKYDFKKPNRKRKIDKGEGKWIRKNNG